MQRTGQPPLIASARSRWPVLLFSHGLGGSPISGDHIEVFKLFASHGYVVAAPFKAIRASWTCVWTTAIHDRSSKS